MQRRRRDGNDSRGVRAVLVEAGAEGGEDVVVHGVAGAVGEAKMSLHKVQQQLVSSESANKFYALETRRRKQRKADSEYLIQNYRRVCSACYRELTIAYSCSRGNGGATQLSPYEGQLSNYAVVA